MTKSKNSRFQGKFLKLWEKDLSAFKELNKAVTEWYNQKETKEAYTIDGINLGEALVFPLGLRLLFNSSENIYENKISKISRKFLNGLSKKQADILIFLESNVRVMQYLPIINELRKRKVSFKVITSNLSIRIKMFSMGIPCDIVKPKRVDAQEYTSKVLSTINKDYFYQGTNITPIIKNAVSSWTNHLIGLKGYLDELFKIKKPKAIILEHDVPADAKLMVLVAKSKKIKTFVLQHGGGIFELIGYMPSIADKVLTWGEDAREAYSRAGYNNAISTGNPLFDNPLPNIKKIKKKLGISNEKVILITPSRDRNASMEEYRDFLDKLLEILSRINNLKIIIKLHPLDRGEFHYDLMKKYPKVIYVRTPSLKSMLEFKIKSLDTLAVMSISDAVLSDAGSSTLLEAFALGKAGIQFNPRNSDKLNLTPFQIKNLKEAGKVVREVLSMDKHKFEKAKEQVVKAHLHKVDKKAASRIVDLMLR